MLHPHPPGVLSGSLGDLTLGPRLKRGLTAILVENAGERVVMDLAEVP
jgi:hypothetical protein